MSKSEPLLYTDTQPEYYFGYGVGPHNHPSLEAVKTWMQGDDQRFDTFTIVEYGLWDEAQTDEHELEDILKTRGLEAALNQAERLAVIGGYLDPNRADRRVFFQDDAPPDSSTTECERMMERAMQNSESQQDPEYGVEAIAANDESRLEVLKIQDDAHDTEPDPPTALERGVPDYPTIYQDFAAEATHDREAKAGLEGSAWFDATFEKSSTELLQPVHDTVNYAVVVQEADPWTLELAVEKYWKEPGGYLGIQSLTLDTWDSEDERARGTAEQARDDLLNVHDQRGLEATMHQAELTAVQNDWLDAGRADSRLFTQGPTDRFETLAQQLEGEMNPFWNIDGEKIKEPQPNVESPYWRLDTLPVNDPEGQPLGHALHMVVYPEVERDPNTLDNPIIGGNEPFKLLEMAHFETTAAADNFSKEFTGYLIPGVLDGPELAVEVAWLEEMPAEWKTLEGDDLKAYHSSELILTRNSSDWHPYNPNAEHDARIAAEGLYSDPIQVIEHDEPETTPNTQALDF